MLTLQACAQAKDAFARALSLDPDNVPAMVGLAVLDINKADVMLLPPSFPCLDVT